MPNQNLKFSLGEVEPVQRNLGGVESCSTYVLLTFAFRAIESLLTFAFRATESLLTFALRATVSAVGGTGFEPVKT